MHRSLLVLAALSCSFTVACNEEDPAALFADVSYQVRCIDCQPLTNDSPARNLAIVDGQDDTSLRCELANGQISLEIETAEYSFEILATRMGDDPGDQCEVRVKEGTGNEYRGRCKPVGGSGDEPCEVELIRDGSGFNGTVMCDKIASHLNASLFRYVTSPSDSGDPAEVSVQGCAGL